MWAASTVVVDLRAPKQRKRAGAGAPPILETLPASPCLPLPPHRATAAVFAARTPRPVGTHPSPPPLIYPAFVESVEDAIEITDREDTPRICTIESPYVHVY